jgi:hypothetical protein
VAAPIPSSPANSMAKGAAKNALPRTTATTPAAPKTTGSVNPAPKTSGQKLAASADPVGDICLLPDIARFTH